MIDDFVHIPKASGSTLRAIISRQYGAEHTLHFEPESPDWRKEHDESPARFLKQKIESGSITLISGHHSFGLHELVGRPMRAFSILRDPISRALSDYFYAFSYQGHRHGEDIRSGRLSVEAFLTEPEFGAQTEQLERIAGAWGESGDSERAALNNAAHCFSAIGLTERFEESALYIAKVLCWKPPIFVKRNVTQLDTRQAESRRHREAEAKERFSGQFGGEYRLYNFVDQMLTQRIAAEGEAFRKALEAYRGIQAEIETLACDDVFKTFPFDLEDELPIYASRLVESDAYRIVEDYLAAPIEHIPRPRNYCGFADVCEGNLIAGWALDLWNDAPIPVTVFRNGQKIHKTNCSLIRPDVAQAIGSRPEVGFRIELDETIADPREYSICFEATSLALRRSQ
jgi:hypothetical protein